ncbi:MAG: Ppx/GppA phosphatase family protein [Candidatus Kapaibacterium sp.]|nr:Ppx/GppA family phosphatase [Ignavibacteriota bacterium]
MICASVDIGTNTLLLLIAEVIDGKIIKIIADEHQIARLGEGLNESGIISDRAIIRASRILHDYKLLMSRYNVVVVNATATSAMRDAKNNVKVKELFESILGTKINIINGLEEARLSYIGSIEKLTNNFDVVLDIGGGSTEIIAGRNSSIEFSTSLQIGAVRITEIFFKDFASKRQNLDEARLMIKDRYKEITFGEKVNDLIAVAGTPTTIAAIDLNLPQYNAHLIHNHKLKRNNLESIVEIFINKKSEELVKEYNVHPNRADVILGGALILLEFLIHADKSELIVSCRGLRYGLILDIFKK